MSLADIIDENAGDSLGSDVSENALRARKIRGKLKGSASDSEPNKDSERNGMLVPEVKSKASQIIAAAADRELNEMMSKTVGSPEPQEEQDAKSDSSSSSPDRTSALTRRRRRRRRSCSLRKLVGCMYGPLEQQTHAATAETKYDRHGVPVAMLARAQKDKEKLKVQANVLRRVRLSHMGYTLPPTKNDSSDDESIQNVKRLALIRTPYFLLPTVKISKVRKKERRRNAFLKDDRLNRINLLLFERSGKTPPRESESRVSTSRDSRVEASDHAASGRNVAQKICSRFFQFVAKKKGNVDPVREKYHKLISDKFSEHRAKCEPGDQVRAHGVGKESPSECRPLTSRRNLFCSQVRSSLTTTSRAAKQSFHWGSIRGALQTANLKTRGPNTARTPTK